MHPQELSIDDFTYVLPPGRIAQFPLPQRDQSKLLVYNKGDITEKIFSSLPELLPADSLLIFNDTKVIQARLLFTNSTDAHIELFLLEPVEPYTDMRLAIFQHEPCMWRCLVGNAKRWREEMLQAEIKVGDKTVLLKASFVKNEGETYLIKFEWQLNDVSFADILATFGHVPLPPYMKRPDKVEDKTTYQTIYGSQNGSVAAPTAGLHFTEQVFAGLKSKNITTDFVTLHVGAGTFKPVKTSTMRGHQMHSERVYIKKSTIEKVLAQLGKGQIVVVGTTSLRTLESLHWFGRQLIMRGMDDVEEMNITQWEAYAPTGNKITTEEALKVVLEWMNKKDKTELTGYTQIIIAPGYTFRLVNTLITNFHQPKSTLLLLIAAFIGEDWHKVYDYALQHDFRFLSYGDSSLLFRG